MSVLINKYVLIEKLFKEINNDDLNEDFLGVYPSDKISKFIMFEKMMPGKKLFLDFKHGYNRNFYSYGIEGVKHFIISNEKK